VKVGKAKVAFKAPPQAIIGPKDRDFEVGKRDPGLRRLVRPPWKTFISSQRRWVTARQ